MVTHTHVGCWILRRLRRTHPRSCGSRASSSLCYSGFFVLLSVCLNCTKRDPLLYGFRWSNHVAWNHDLDLKSPLAIIWASWLVGPFLPQEPLLAPVLWPRVLPQCWDWNLTRNQWKEKILYIFPFRNVACGRLDGDAHQFWPSVQSLKHRE